jgi:hypothetical protein
MEEESRTVRAKGIVESAMDRRHILEAGIGTFPAATNLAWGSARVPKRQEATGCTEMSPRTGQTKSARGASVATRVFTSTQDEQYGMTAADG